MPPRRLWPRCTVPGCDFFQCRALDSVLCYLHTPGTEREKQERMLAQRAANANECEADDTGDDSDVEYLT